MSASVQLLNVSKNFPGGATAVDHVSLSIERGEYVSIIGPSGCGKTTSLRMVAGFEGPTSGRIEIGGRDCTTLEPHHRNTAMVFQHFALFPHMTVAGNVAFGLEMRGVPGSERQTRVADILKAVDIGDLADRMSPQLSGGQQQRVGLARALVTRPEVLLLDEPLGSLDANLRERMIRVLKRLNGEFGIAFMHVTHSQSEAFAVSDRVVIMNRGRIEQIGPPEEVARNPCNLFVAQFVGKNNLIPGRIVGEDGGVARVATEVGEVRARLGGLAAGHEAACWVVCPAHRVELLRDGESLDTTLTGRLAFTLFETSHLEFNVEMGHDKVLRIDRFGPTPGLAGLKPGAAMRLGWKAQDAFLVAA
jgi:putative spermidine/putrescine transport system ATP-binding protein/spermidine/putrescine transport system ATP-binding protein